MKNCQVLVDLPVWEVLIRPFSGTFNDTCGAGRVSGRSYLPKWLSLIAVVRVSRILSRDRAARSSQSANNSCRIIKCASSHTMFFLKRSSTFHERSVQSVRIYSNECKCIILVFVLGRELFLLHNENSNWKKRTRWLTFSVVTLNWFFKLF